MINVGFFVVVVINLIPFCALFSWILIGCVLLNQQQTVGRVGEYQVWWHQPCWDCNGCPSGLVRAAIGWWRGWQSSPAVLLAGCIWRSIQTTRYGVHVDFPTLYAVCFLFHNFVCVYLFHAVWCWCCQPFGCNKKQVLCGADHNLLNGTQQLTRYASCGKFLDHFTNGRV